MPVTLSVYDGRHLLGVVSGHRRAWEVFHTNGVRIGSYRSRKAALAAVNASLPCSCVGDMNARGDNSE